MACGLALKRQLDLDSPLGPMHPHSPKRQRTSPYAVATKKGGMSSSPSRTPPAFSDSTDNITEDLIDAAALQAKRLLQGSRGNSSGEVLPVHSPSGDNLNDLVKSFLTQCGVAGADEDRPLFSLKQVVALCAKLLQQREEHIRSEYDAVLERKLAEQYETFTRWAQDELHRRFNDGTPSYVS